VTVSNVITGPCIGPVEPPDGEHLGNRRRRACYLITAMGCEAELLSERVPARFAQAGLHCGEAGAGLNRSMVAVMHRVLRQMFPVSPVGHLKGLDFGRSVSRLRSVSGSCGCWEQ